MERHPVFIAPLRFTRQQHRPTPFDKFPFLPNIFVHISSHEVQTWNTLLQPQGVDKLGRQPDCHGEERDKQAGGGAGFVFLSFLNVLSAVSQAGEK